MKRNAKTSCYLEHLEGAIISCRDGQADELRINAAQMRLGNSRQAAGLWSTVSDLVLAVVRWMLLANSSHIIQGLTYSRSVLLRGDLHDEAVNGRVGVSRTLIDELESLIGLADGAVDRGVGGTLVDEFECGVGPADGAVDGGVSILGTHFD